MFSTIPRVKSLAWGYCSDAFDDSSFNEILVVSSDASITVYVMCSDTSDFYYDYV
jgi:spatacsin